MAVKPGYLVLAGLGGIVLWSGIKGHKWTTSVRDIVSGQQPSGQELAITGSAYAAAVAPSASQTAGAVGGTVAKNMAIGRVLASAYGWGSGAQWDALVALWNQESGWNNRARNPGSGAYGIPQALPPTKLPALGRPPVSSATVQIGWGLNYIKQRYTDPITAEEHEKANSWY
jgi:hypothetical protein